MRLPTIIFIALSLAMDAFAVSITNGIVIREKRHRLALIYALSFGFFQGFMPFIGWSAGRRFHSIIDPVAHWIAFFLLFLIGSKMIYESMSTACDLDECSLISLRMVFVLSIATSIDALAMGITFSILKLTIILPVIIIGIITFVLSYAGFYLGNRIGANYIGKGEITGGIILIGIGIKIVVEHYYF